MATIYALDHPHETQPRLLRSVLGAKGASLAELTSVLGLPVPPGFTIVTPGSIGPEDPHLESAKFRSEFILALQAMEHATASCFGCRTDPLLVSVRAGAEIPMPGAMEAVLNVGLNDETVLGLAAATNDVRFAYDSYRRLIQRYGELVLNVPSELFNERLRGAKQLCGARTGIEMPSDVLIVLVRQFQEIIEDECGEPFPQNPEDQLAGAVRAAFDQWDNPSSRAYRSRERLSHRSGTAVTVQKMVFGNRDDLSGTGVAFTHDPASGALGLSGSFGVGGQGDDITEAEQATHTLDELEPVVPDAIAELRAAMLRLEAHYRDMVSVEFTIEQGSLWLLQARQADRSGVAAVRVALEMHERSDIALSRAEALQLVTGKHVEQILHPQFEDNDVPVLATGLGASPGAAVGHVYFSADDALDAYDRGEDVILVKDETSPADVPGMAIAEGILTTKGGLASHAAVVARGWGKPAVCGVAQITVSERYFEVGSTRVAEGEVISIDGASGSVLVGSVETSAASATDQLDTILGWADAIRRDKIEVRANADTAKDATLALEFGAEGIGLCRTEHQFLGERLPLIQALILAEDDEAEQLALDALAKVQQSDFFDLFSAMDGLPITVRLLDPPLHEFLPSVEQLAVKKAAGELSHDEQQLLRAAREWQEENPMLGTRGVRLGILRPALVRMQARAVMHAAHRLAQAGGDPHVEIMIPLIINRAELDLVRGWIEAEIASANMDAPAPLAVLVGSMVETPRAALCAGDIAAGADFFSFGTNDLTQMTLGFSRDDVENRLVGEYLNRSLLGANPFETLDVRGVGQLVQSAATAARESNPLIKLGVCGEHGGDPASIEFFWQCGLDYVSCSPYRVPVARLAAAQAITNSSATPGDDAGAGERAR